MDNKIFIDIETIPSETMPKLEDIKAPANYKDEAKIKAYREENQLEIYKKQALDSMQGRIICIGVGHENNIQTITADNDDEAAIVIAFSNLIWSIFLQIRETPHFVGWNIGSFDLPWLWRKAVQYNLPELRRLIPKDNRNLYTDLMKVWASDYKDYVSLSNCAKFLGIEHGTDSGADVYDYWKAGEIDKIFEHCRQDIKTTMEVYGRIYG
jgi:predicted PolB exonuclease-like 3'-5' exonuclease